MNAISTEVWVGLVGVGLGFLGSLIVMLVGSCLQAWREARRIADQRRYERVKDRVDKVEPYIERLKHLSDEVRAAVEEAIRWTLWMPVLPDTRPSERPTMVQYYLDILEGALEKAGAVLKEDPGIILESLEPQILDGFDELKQSFNRLYLLAGKLLLEHSRLAEGSVPSSKHWASIEMWAEEMRAEIVSEHETFKGVYKTLVMAIGNLLQGRYRRPSWVKRLRGWWVRRKQKEAIAPKGSNPADGDGIEASAGMM